MASKSLCVSCAQLPQKDRTLAIKLQECPDCNTVFGVTSYGAPFRIMPVSRSFMPSSPVIAGLAIGAALFMLVVVLVGLGFWSSEQIVTTRRVADPTPPNELARIPEVAVEDAYPRNISPAIAKERMTGLIVRIKGENNAKQDAFVLSQMDRRPELRGLPFVMGDACRLEGGRAQTFQHSVEAVRQSFDRDSGRFRDSASDDKHTAFWNAYFQQTNGQGAQTESGVAALSQMLAPERQALRHGLVTRLADSNRPEATRALARAAVFDTDGEVRDAAIRALRKRAKEPSKESGEILMHGLRYPMAAVSKRSAQAIIMLDRKDLLPQMVQVLDEPAPGDPADKVVEDKKVCVVREVVRINHHRNCLLCHPPSDKGQPNEVPGVMPIPGSPFPQSPSEAYGSAQSLGDPMIRADTTYLRQDFSMMMPVENAAPWPDKQRFDFLVRERVVEGKELARLEQQVRARPAGQLSENHKATLEALRRMTGQENVAPNAAAWQRVLGVGDND